jgi:transcriptional regulator with XRE-family HTH domain
MEKMPTCGARVGQDDAMADVGGDDHASIDQAIEREEDLLFVRTVGRRLRAIRQAQGLSLADVESRSNGRWSSSAVGAYERGFRNLSLPRLRALAEFYRVPVAVLLGEPGPYNAPPERKKIVLSLEALRTVDPAEPVQRFVQSIIEARGDFNGKVLSLRHNDLQALCTLIGGDIPTGNAQLRSWGILLDGPDPPTYNPLFDADIVDGVDDDDEGGAGTTADADDSAGAESGGG